MIALLSNVTVESLKLRLEKALGEGVYTPSGFDTWRMALLDAASPLWNSNVKTVYVVLHGPSLLAEALDPQAFLAGLLALLKQAQAAHRGMLFVVSTLDIPPFPAAPLVGGASAARLAWFWRETLENEGFPLLDLAELVAVQGRERFYNAKTWYFGALPFSQQGERALTDEINRIESAVRGRRKKCLVLDLDNTLWGGVIGEDGLQGISLAQSGLGSQYRDFQQVAKSLAGQGVLLAIASKNNLEDALIPLREHPDMVLREDDFIRIKADWGPKVVNIAAIAEELNIGLDSLVFVDDNPLEREAVKAACPEVAVPDFPTDSAQLPAFGAWLARTYFTALRVGAEDLKKNEMYKAESRREASRSAHLSLEAYLASLEMVLDLHRVQDEEIARAAQLTQKTNQFNLTTRRYTEPDLRRLAEDKGAQVWIAQLKDRFGDYGKICLAIAKTEQREGVKVALFDTFLMSCRVMGRGVEEAVLSAIEQALTREGVTVFYGEYVPTPKNAPVEKFWPAMGYVPEGGLWVLRAPLHERKTWVCLNC